MSVSTLPDDILRSLAAFISPSGLILVVRCSHWLVRVLHDQLTRRLDDLFVVTQREIQTGKLLHIELLTQPLPDELVSLLGVASINDSFGSAYSFAKAPKGYDGHRRNLGFYRQSAGCSHRYFVVEGGPNYSVHLWVCFVTLLQRRLERLGAAEA
jgi:hypothetical protein